MRQVGVVYGVGINDADYVVRRAVVVDGKKKYLECIFYTTWVNMLKRCFSKSHAKARPSYAGSEVCAEWLRFSAFKAWMEKQTYLGENGERLQLDKDLLSGSKRGKLYSPETCVFITSALNAFLLDSSATRGDLPLGVCWHKNLGKYVSNVRDPFTKRHKHLGVFSTVEEAQAAYVKQKRLFSVEIAKLQTDPRIKEALLSMDWK